MTFAVLGIETSCDETAIAVVEGGRRIRSNVVASQVALHAATGGIVPEVAARAHLRWIVPVMDEALATAGVTMRDVDAVAEFDYVVRAEKLGVASRDVGAALPAFIRGHACGGVGKDGQHVGRLVGAHAARAMLGAKEPYQAVPWFWSDHYDLTLQIAGVPSEGVTLLKRMIDEDSEILFHIDWEGRLVGASGLSRGNKIARDIRLAEMLIANRSYPDQQALIDPNMNLKSLPRA